MWSGGRNSEEGKSHPYLRHTSREPGLCHSTSSVSLLTGTSVAVYILTYIEFKKNEQFLQGYFEICEIL